MKIIEVAKKYVGMRENPNNRFDVNTPLGKILHKAGQRNGEPWCAYFCEAVAVEAYPEKAEELQKLFSASTIATFRNFQLAGFKTSNKPSVGDIVIWQRYKAGAPTMQGHAGIVISVIPSVIPTWGRDTFQTIEGNTNSSGSREGDSVQYKDRALIINNADGLNILGFINLGYEQ